MGNIKFKTSAALTRSAQTERGRRLSRAITAKKSSRFIRATREVLAAAREADPAAPPARQFGYGLIEMPTVRRFRQIDDQGRLHQIHVIQADEIDGVLAYIIEANSTVFLYPGNFPGQIRPDGSIFSGRFKGVGSQVRLFDGTQVFADPDLVEQTEVDSQFIGQGLAYVWSRFTFQEGRFNGDPNVRVIARSRKILDPRDAVLSPSASFEDLPKTFSFNPYRFVFDYLLRPVLQGGLGIPMSQVNIASFLSSSTWADGVVDTQNFTATAIFTTRSNQTIGKAPIRTDHLFEFNAAISPFQYGDVVQAFAGPGETLPPNIVSGRDYHVIPVRHAAGDFQLPAVALADSLDDAMNGVSIAQGERVSDIQLTKVGEIRYQSGLTYRSGDQILDRMLESCGARLFLDDGQIAITSQRFPEGAIDQVALGEHLGGIALSTKIDPDDRVNRLSGTFTSLLNLFLPATYPIVDGGGLFLADDNNVPLPGELNLPFVAKASVAQRLATTQLRRSRQELAVAFSGGLSLYRLKPNTIFSLDFSKYGLDANTTFEVRDQTLFLEIAEDRPSIGVNIEARQLEAGTFDLDISNEQFLNDAAIPGLGSVFDVEPPGVPTIVENLFRTRPGAGVRSSVTVSWSPSSDGFVTAYLVSYKLSANIDFIFQAETPDLSLVIQDLAPGDYDFRVEAINSIGLRSDPLLAQIQDFQIFGLSARPAAPTSFRGEVVSTASVLLTWDRSPELDVIEGGFAEVRHNPAISGAAARDSTFLKGDVGGQQAALVPFKQGTYFLRFEDSQGQFSEAAAFSTQSRRPVGIAQDINLADIGAGGFTIQEDNTFPSSNPANTLIFVTDHLELPLSDTFDDETDVDAILDMDVVGGGEVAEEGLYFFNTSLELASTTRVVLEAVLAAEVFDLTASIDDELNFDDIPDVDLVAAVLLEPGNANADIEVRFSNGTIASDTFGPWEVINTGFFDARSFEFRVRARSFRPSVNIRITQARVRLRAVPLG